MIPLYRCRDANEETFKRYPASAYICERAGTWARHGSKEEAMKQTKEWWEENLSSTALNYFKLELVED